MCLSLGVAFGRPVRLALNYFQIDRLHVREPGHLTLVVVVRCGALLARQPVGIHQPFTLRATKRRERNQNMGSRTVSVASGVVLVAPLADGYLHID